MTEKNSKQTDPMSTELKAIRRVAKAIEGLAPAARRRVVNYVSDSLYQEQYNPSSLNQDPALLAGIGAAKVGG